MKKAAVYAILVVGPLALLVVANVSTQEMPGEGVITADGAYINPQHLFMVRPPRGWVPTEKFPPALAPSAVVSFELPAPGPWYKRARGMGGKGDAKANVMVRVWRWKTSLDRVVALMKDPNRALQYRIKSEGPTVVGGYDGYRLHYSWGQFMNLEAGEHVEHYVSRGDKIYLVSYMTFKDVPFDTYLKEADAAIRSFRFLEKIEIDVMNGAVVVDGKSYGSLPVTLYLTSAEPHTLVAEPRRPWWPWANAGDAFRGWSDGHASPARTVTVTKATTFVARFDAK